MTETLEELNPTDDQWFEAADPPPTGPGPEPAPDPVNAPHGWMVDKGAWRAKRAPGRPPRQRTAEELTAEPVIKSPPDVPPEKGKRAPRPPAEDVPMPRGGVIAKGMDSLYRQVGKVLRIIGAEAEGAAVIACTRRDPDEPDLPTTGEAWEQLARNNPRIRAFLLRLIQGNDWQTLLLAHLPIGMALMTHDWVRRYIPMQRAAEVMFEPDEDGNTPMDLLPEDVEDMQAMAQQQAERMASRMGVKVPEGVARAAMEQAAAASNGGTIPPGFQRQQTRHRSRAQRRGGR